MTKPRFFDRKAQPIDWLRCVELSAEPDYVTIAESGSQRYGYRVTTRWLGMAQANWLDPPLLFETVVTSNLTPPPDYRRRYATEDEAFAGHYEAEEYAEKLIAKMTGAT
jgi:hypothetical protein